MNKRILYLDGEIGIENLCVCYLEDKYCVFEYDLVW